MVDKTKILYLNSAFTKDLPTAGETIESIYIEGYASTNDVDRAGDVVPVSVWEAGMKNYLNNPIILAQHDHDDPIGRMVEHKLDSKGLWIKARISAAAEVFSLIKDEVLTAFSIGFRVLDAEYNAAAELFVIKELELIEISVVSVPCNQNTLFNLSKAFENEEDYTKFKAQFAPKGDSAKGLETPTGNKGTTTSKEWNMDPKELEIMLANTAKAAAEQATAAVLAAQKAEKEAAEKAAAEKAAFDASVAAAVKAQVEVGTSGTERLLADLEKRITETNATSTKAFADLQGELAAKAQELQALQKSKMVFANGGKDVDYAEREKAVLLAKIKGISVDSTKFGQDLSTKTGAHLPSATWELEVSTNMEAEIRRRLVVASIMNPIAMKTNVMTIPVNPEAGFATWVTNAQFGTTASAGAAQTHAVKEITLNAYKVATAEYMAYEEEEDSLLVLLPIIRDAMIRRVAKAVDKAFLLGAGSGADPVKGFATYDATSAVNVTTASGVATIANMRAMRADLGAWGLEQSELRFIVSTEAYYNLLDDTLFQTMDKVGPQATLLTGQIGMIGQTPVIVSDAFAAKATGANTATTNYGAICVAPANFIAGSQRGLRMDTQELVETQRRVMVASLRTGMTQLSTVNGPAVSVLRWLNA